MIGTVTKTDKGYIWLELTPEETTEILEKLRKVNTKEFEQCCEMASMFLESIGVEHTTERMIEVARGLFDKQGTASYTMLLNALDKKKHKLKNKPIGSPEFKVAETTEEAKKIAEEKLKKEPSVVKNGRESMIDKALKDEYICAKCHVPYKDSQALLEHKCPAEKDNEKES